MAEALHLSSLVVTCRAQHTAEVVARIARVPGAEVAAARDGRIAVVVEGADEHALAGAMHTFSFLPHVYSAVVVSHYVDEDEP